MKLGIMGKKDEKKKERKKEDKIIKLEGGKEEPGGLPRRGSVAAREDMQAEGRRQIEAVSRRSHSKLRT